MHDVGGGLAFVLLFLLFPPTRSRILHRPRPSPALCRKRRARSESSYSNYRKSNMLLTTKTHS